MLKQILRAALCALMLAFVPGGADAAPEIIEADGIYLMGDNDTPKSARDAARNEAMRAATEQAGVYIESTSEVQGYALTRDEIRTVAAAILRVLLANKPVAFDLEAGCATLAARSDGQSGRDLRNWVDRAEQAAIVRHFETGDIDGLQLELADFD